VFLFSKAQSQNWRIFVKDRARVACSQGLNKLSGKPNATHHDATGQCEPDDETDVWSERATREGGS
jgi:hypothetical protein